MKAHQAKCKRHIPLRDRVDRRLTSYAVAAASAGAGLVGLARPAEAEVVYTPTHVAIGVRGSYPLDLTNDGTTDFTIRNATLVNTSTRFSTLLALPAVGNAVAGVRFRSRHFAYALQAGAKIGSNQNFVRQYPVMGLVIDSPGGGQYSGSWVHVTNRYLGLKFQINGEAHYGWARMSVNIQMSRRVEAVLTGYAYETQPNTSIFAGQESGQSRLAKPGVRGQSDASLMLQPATLGVLARGAEGLPLWRREHLETATVVENTPLSTN